MPADASGGLYHLLALYAALDEAVTQSDDPNIAATVEGFLPGTTGPGQRGWSRSITEFLGGQLPEVNTALGYFAEGPALTRPQLSRLVYIVGSLAHIPAYTIDNDQSFVDVLTLARPQRVPRPDAEFGDADSDGVPATAAVSAADPGGELLTLLQEGFNNRQDWGAVTARAVDLRCLDAIAASVPLCDACLTTHGGIPCVVVDTRFESTAVSVSDMTAILDPRNWGKIAGEFFCSMADQGPVNKPGDYDGWGRVLETVSVWCGSGLPVLKTDLMFYKSESASGDQAVVQYDLDIQPTGDGDGQVTVDKGWLKVATGTSTGSTGVTVSTRKVVHINGLSPAALTVFVCAMGYGQSSLEMLLGGALNPPPGLVAWSDPPVPVLTKAARHAQTSQPGSAPTGTAAGAIPTTAAGLAVSMFSQYLADVTHDTSDIAAKCANHQLTVDDLANFGAKFGARIAGEPWRFLKRLSELPPPGPVQGGNS